MSVIIGDCLDVLPTLEANGDLFDTGPWRAVHEVASFLTVNHYLGPARRGGAYKDDAGVIVVAPCTARALPQDWREITGWCLVRGERNSGSKQWARFIRVYKKRCPEVTTLVSYSDPSAGHDGALYRACNWWWAPTWHRLRPPPTGNGSWTDGNRQAVKDRWIFPLRKDCRRASLLVAQDEGILRRDPTLRYAEPGGRRLSPPWPRACTQARAGGAAVTRARERRTRLLTLVCHISPVRGAMTASELARFTRDDPDPIPTVLAQRLLEGLAIDGKLQRVPAGPAIGAYRMPTERTT